MAQRADDIGHDIEDTRAAMTAKLAILEERVLETVVSTQASVEEIVEHVKGTVGDTVATVKRTLDLPSQVGRHPWPMVGGALLAGYMLGSRGGGRPSAAGSPRDIPGAEASRPGSPPASHASPARPEPQQGIVSGMLDQLNDEMQDEIASLKSVAVGAVMHMLREMCKQAMPTLAPPLEKAHTKRGGQASDSPAPPPAAMPSAALNGVSS